MLRLSRILPLVCALVLAVPGSALAGGAGDDQYQDPFADPPAQSEQPAPSQDESAPAAPAPQAEAGAAAGSQATPAPAQAAPALPRTGAEAGLTAIGGGVLLLAGMALRRRTADGARA